MVATELVVAVELVVAAAAALPALSALAPPLLCICSSKFCNSAASCWKAVEKSLLDPEALVLELVEEDEVAEAALLKDASETEEVVLVDAVPVDEIALNQLV